MIEVLAEQRLELITPDGSFPASVYRPARPGPNPVVLLCAEASLQGYGVSSIARSLASDGYYVMVRGLEEETTSCLSALSGVAPVDVRRVARETEALVRHMDGDPAAMATEIGAIGFGAGGAYAVAAAVHEPARIKALATINGRQLITDREDSPHRLVKLVAAEMYFGFSRHDDLPNGDDLARLAKALEDCTAPYRVDRRLDIPPGPGALEMAVAQVDEKSVHPRMLLRALLGRRLPQAEGGPIACSPAQA